MKLKGISEKKKFSVIFTHVDLHVITYFCILFITHFTRMFSKLCVLNGQTTVGCQLILFDNDYVRKQPMAWKEYCAKYWFKELQESMDRCTGRRYITGILAKIRSCWVKDECTCCEIFVDGRCLCRGKQKA